MRKKYIFPTKKYNKIITEKIETCQKWNFLSCQVISFSHVLLNKDTAFFNIILSSLILVQEISQVLVKKIHFIGKVFEPPEYVSDLLGFGGPQFKKHYFRTYFFILTVQ